MLQPEYSSALAWRLQASALRIQTSGQRAGLCRLQNIRND